MSSGSGRWQTPQVSDRDNVQIVNGNNFQCQGVRILMAKILSLSGMDRFTCDIMTRHALEPEGFSVASSKWNLKAPSENPTSQLGRS